MKVLILGAAGPVAGAAIRALEPYHTLRLADVRPMESAHETRAVDVADPAQVDAAAAGMDAIANFTVVRPDPVLAFDVNTRGAYNVMRAAVAHGIRRVVQTGPFLQHLGYESAWGITEAAPMAPGTGLYALSKWLGQEVCRAFAYAHNIEVACLLFCLFRDPGEAPGGGLEYFAVSWRDSGEAVRRAVEVERLPSPFEVFNITADLPHRKYLNDKAKAVLGWQPRDDFAGAWRRNG